jgi:hypothetical protein
MLESLRRRRRLIIATSVILIASLLTFLGVRHTTSGSTQNADRPSVRDSFYWERRGDVASSSTRRVAQPQDAGSPRGRVRVDTAWLLVPLGVMALIMLIPPRAEPGLSRAF